MQSFSVKDCRISYFSFAGIEPGLTLVTAKRGTLWLPWKQTLTRMGRAFKKQNPERR
jgi:hypothetical protein